LTSVNELLNESVIKLPKGDIIISIVYTSDNVRVSKTESSVIVHSISFTGSNLGKSKKCLKCPIVIIIKVICYQEYHQFAK